MTQSLVHFIFNNAVDSLLLIDQSGKIVEVNQTFLNLFEMKPDNVVGCYYHEVIKEKTFTGLEKKIFRKEEIDEDVELKIFNQRNIPVEFITKRIDIDQEVWLLCSIRNMEQKLKRSRENMQLILHIEEKERSRFATELHDGLGPLLSAMKMYLTAFKESSSEEKRNRVILNVQELIQEALTAIKEISNNLSPYILNDFGLLHAVKTLIERVKDTAGPEIYLNTNFHKLRLHPVNETALYRMIQELLNNTLKHASATLIEVTLYKSPTGIIFIYHDNGCGFDYEKKIADPNDGLGLKNIKNRMQGLGGKIFFFSSPGKGVRIFLEIKDPG